MSVEAVAWALRWAPVKSAQEHVLLIALADRADEYGRSAWPYQEDLAKRGRCEVRTVRRHLNAMKKRGLIMLGDQRLVAHLRADKRPIVYDLNLSMRLDPEPPPEPVALAADTTYDRPDNLSGRSTAPADRRTTDRPRRAAKASDRTNGAANASDDRADNMSGRTQLWSSDRTQLCPTIRPERPSFSAGDVGGEGYVGDARGAFDDDNPPPWPPKFHAEHPAAWVPECEQCETVSEAYMAFTARRMDAARAASVLGARPVERCPAHITDDNPPPCRRCKAAREAAEDWDTARAAMVAEAGAARRTVIEDCAAHRAANGLPRLCDEYGWRIPPQGLEHAPAVRCDHRSDALPAAWAAAIAERTEEPAGV